MYSWYLIRYIWWHHMHCKQHHIHYFCKITTTVSVSSHPHFRWYHTLCMYGITPTVHITSYTLYKSSHPHFMTSQHITYVSTCTVFMASLPWYLTLYPLYLCHHNHSSDDLWPILCVISHPLYVWHPMNCTYSHIHSLWTDTIVVNIVLSLDSWHHTHYIWRHTHDNTNVISAVSSTITDTPSTVSVSSNAVHQLYHTHSLDDITHTLCMT